MSIYFQLQPYSIPGETAIDDWFDSHQISNKVYEPAFDAGILGVYYIEDISNASILSFNKEYSGKYFLKVLYPDSSGNLALNKIDSDYPPGPPPAIPDGTPSDQENKKTVIFAIIALGVVAYLVLRK